jgi:DNA-binding NarL/FixJ family response regulator
MTVRLLLADDQRVVRDGLVLLLGLLPDVELVGAAEDGDEVVALAAELPPVPDALADGLTAREGEVLTLVAAGMSNAEIAGRLVVSEATVKTHINRIFAKTGVRDRAQAVSYVYRAGLTRP